MRRVGLLLCIALVSACDSGDPGGGESTQGAMTGEVVTTSGSGSGSGGSGQEDGNANTSVGFVPDNDYDNVQHCDPFMQDCPGGEKCVPYASSGGNWDDNKCVPITGNGEPGDPCTYDGPVQATDSCGATSMCWNVGDVDGEAIGTCTPFCTGTADDPMCPAGSSCAVSSGGSVTVCNETCDPILQDCLGLGCYWSGIGFECIAQTQDLGLGEPCGYINDCVPTLMCVDGSLLPSCAGAACCAQFCDLGVGACDMDGTECVAWFEPGTAPPEWAHVGVCLAVGA